LTFGLKFTSISPEGLRKKMQLAPLPCLRRPRPCSTLAENELPKSRLANLSTIINRKGEEKGRQTAKRGRAG
jgi:hypothetical protein